MVDVRRRCAERRNQASSVPDRSASGRTFGLWNLSARRGSDGVMFAVLVAAVAFPGLRMAGPTDVDLVARFKAGDRSAFNEIVRRYQDRVYSLCYRWLNEAEAAEETAQDVFLALFRSLATFRGDATLSTFLFKITLNHCRNRRAHRARRAWGRHEPLTRVGDDDAPPREVADEGPAPDRGTTAREANAIITEALAALDEDHRQILLLRDVEDLSYEEIADILDLPRGTVKSRLHRARAELAVALGRRVRAQDVL
jgi:RNA polymerase sigma-70 factor (ECF subfamily)